MVVVSKDCISVDFLGRIWLTAVIKMLVNFLLVLRLISIRWYYCTRLDSNLGLLIRAVFI